MSKRIIVYKSGGYYSQDELYEIGRILSNNSHKPSDDDEGVIKQQRGEKSEYDIMDKTVKITIEISE